MLAALVLFAVAFPGVEGGARYLTYPEVREVTEQFDGAPPAAAWDAWVRESDREVRERVARGAEDSVTNLLLYGTSFTSLPRLAGPYEADKAGPRIRALASALAGATTGERLRAAQRALGAGGRSAAEIERMLAAHLARFASEQAAYEEKLRGAARANDENEMLFARATLYARRGLSTDASLLPNWALEDTLRVLKAKGAAPRQIRTIAVIGPGLDFADKRDGFDFYPVQTVQPFALLEAALRLGFAAERVTAFDLNPAVLSHLAQAGKGAPYRIELPRDRSAGWKAEGVQYWEHFGSLIGSPAAARAVPASLPHVVSRAVEVRPEMAGRVSAAELNIVAETCEDRFDLIVATNILVYYDRLHQAIALANVARLLNPGGVFLGNTVLPAQRPAALEFLGRRNVSYSAAGDYGDDIVVYRKRR